MKQLTKKQRREIYLKVAKIFISRSHDYFGTCFHLKKQSGWELNYKPMLEKLFPEFNLFYPKKPFWWGHDETENNERILALLLSSEMCKD